MDLWELLMITVRRWMITLPVAVIAFGVAFAASGSVPPEYKAEAAVGLVGASYAVDPNTGELVDEANPLVIANQGRSALAFTEQLVTSSDEKIKAVENGFSESYTVTLDRFNPILVVEVVGETPDQATQTAAYVVELIKSDIVDRQVLAGEADENQQLDTTTLYVDQVATADATPQTRMRVILMVIALMVTIGAAVLADAYFALRDRRGDKKPGKPEEAEPQDWDDAQELIDSAMQTREVSSVGASSSSDVEEWGRR